MWKFAWKFLWEKDMNQRKKTSSNQKYKGFLLVMMGASLWGTLPIFSNFSYQLGSDAMTSAAMRCYLAAAVFFVWMLANGSLKTLKARELPFYLMYGIVSGGGTFIFYMMAIEQLSTAMAAILLYTGPAFVIIFSRILYKEPITKAKFAALCCTFLGSLLVVRGYDLASVSANGKGLCFGILSGISYSMTTVMGRKANQLHDGQMNAGLMTLFVIPLFLILKPVWSIQIPVSGLWPLYLALALLGTVLPYTFYLKGLNMGIDGGMASITATLEPVVGTVLSVSILHDTLEWPQIFGVAIVIAGVSIPVLSTRKMKES